ncbi:hypothetical protein KR018_002937 [Drosophila ironensis]|nr:hypothetical protein KR018_002937 [Drosophila ironensis]
MLRPIWLIKSANVRRYAKDIRFGAHARNLLLQGVNVMANAVATTLGPHGKNALIEQLLISPKITKDGITVANNVELKDRRLNLGAQLVRQATLDSNNEMGDGSTTATILARGMASQGMKILRDPSVNVQLLREGMHQASRLVCDALKGMSQPIDSIGEVEAVARVVLNGDESLTELIGDAIMELGEDGVILIKASATGKDAITFQDGVHIPTSYASPFFAVGHTNGQLEFEDCLLLVTVAKIEDLTQVLPVLELAKNREKPLLIVAMGYSAEVLKALVINHLHGCVQVCAVKAPGHCQDDICQEMQDLAIATGATLIDDPKLLERIEDKDLGEVEEVMVNGQTTHLLNPRNVDEELKKSRLADIDEERNSIKTDDEIDRLDGRAGMLEGRLAVIHVGGTSELEMNERSDRLRNCVSAVRKAMSDGIQPGGGTAYLRCISLLSGLPRAATREQQMGREIVQDALRLPCYTIARNAGANPDEVVQRVLSGKGNFGYDAATGEYGDLVMRKILDSTSVLRQALAGATGMAAILATTEVLITEEPVRPKIPKNQVTRDLAKMIGM